MPNEPRKRPQNTAKANRPRGRPFTGSNDARNRTAVEAARVVGPDQPNPGNPVPPKRPVEGEGLLAAMRHVLVNHKSHDETEEQRQVRKWLRENRSTFFAKKADLEKAELGRRVGATGGAATGADRPETVVDDPGTDACVALCHQLLARFKAEAEAETKR